MLGLKRFRSASITIAGIELIHRLRKGQFKLGKLRIKDNKAPAISRCMSRVKLLTFRHVDFVSLHHNHSLELSATVPPCQ